MGQNMSKLSCSSTVTDGTDGTNVTENGKELLYAARCRNLRAVKALLENGTDPNKARTDNGETPLYCAAFANNIDMVRLLLLYSANPNMARTDNGETPLYRAAFANNIDMVMLLLLYSANPNMARLSTIGPLYRAAFANNIDMVRLLLLYGANPNMSRSDTGETPLCRAANNNNMEIVELLLSNRADPNMARLHTGETPLYRAVHNDNIDMVRLLLSHRANPNMALLNTGETSLYRGAYNNNMEIVELLLSNDANPNMAFLNTGETPLYRGAYNNNMDIVQKLVLYGAKQEYTNGKDAHHVAKQKGHGDIVHFFEKIKGLTTFQIAVSIPSMQTSEIKKLLQRNVLDPDKCGGSLAEVKALAASNTSTPEEMKRIVRLAFGGWTQHSHLLYSQSFQKYVKTTLMIAQRLEDASEKEESTVVCLPLELWLLVLNFVNRKDWKK